MRKYITEIHCHTGDVSGCGNVPAEEIVEIYVEKGYDSLVITDHINGDTHNRLLVNRPWNEAIDLYLEGYEKARAAAKGRINIIMGVEVAFAGEYNDYLTYGITKEFLLNYPDMHLSKLEDFIKYVHENGAILFQAHPFRNNMIIKNPALLDGIEIYNAHPRHDSRNDIAKMWAEKYDLKICAGSDFQQVGDESRAAIITDVPVTDSIQLAGILKNGNFEIKTADLT